MTERTSIEDRIAALEDIIEEQQETIEELEDRNEKQESVIETLQETVSEDDESPAADGETDFQPSLTRRGAITGLGLAGLVGLGATTAAANPTPQGRVGTEDRPLEALNTTLIRGPMEDAQNNPELDVEVGLDIYQNEPVQVMQLRPDNVDVTGSNIVDAGAANHVIWQSWARRLAANDVRAPLFGTASEEAVRVQVDGNRALELTPEVEQSGEIGSIFHAGNIVSGSRFNSIADGVYGATISGGGRSDHTNEVTENYGTIGGGRRNSVQGRNAVVSGGVRNEVYDDYDAIGGGLMNEVNARHGTIGGGTNNTVTGRNSTIGGGFNNDVTGDNSTVPGGHSNQTAGDYSFASGRRAEVDEGHDGAFLFADSSSDSLISQGSDEARFQMPVHPERGITFEPSEGNTEQLTAGPIATGVIELDGEGGWNIENSVNVSSVTDDELDPVIELDVDPVDTIHELMVLVTPWNNDLYPDPVGAEIQNADPPRVEVNNNTNGLPANDKIQFAVYRLPDIGV